MKTIVNLLLIGMLYSVAAAAQDRPDPNKPQGKNFDVPTEWKVRLDHEMEEVAIGAQPDSSDIYFVNMTPGWHITTGPAAIFYHPANTASGSYKVQSEIHFFDPGDRNREAYGLFFGGQNLQADDQQYYYFLIRNSGEFLIKKRIGEETEVIQSWTPSDAIVKYENGMEESSVRNMLSVSVIGEDAVFHINDQEVASLNAADWENSGYFGLRVNHSINLHISSLSYNAIE